ncbi:hypothetical protein K7887_22795 (plasmid) [Sutcliffiella horikoshii]|uniref:hypothetical protein n=1 Tax=Sutcliffiella horikoshii TaxID=79883 RepID=UPI001CBAE74F|nr:hypothetical protein [Sutcliffiella horikoshii]UAL49797.1 hypothetical protein K7887_22795 [Sutcliffiella horikoshii]
MKPKIRDNFNYIEVEDGLLISTREKNYKIKGKGIRAWLELLKPILNGEFTIEEIIRNVENQKHKEIVKNIIQKLYDIDLIRDISTDETIDNDIYTRFKSQISFVEELQTNPIKVFNNFRNHNFLIIGEGIMPIYVGDFLLENGANSVTIYQNSPLYNFTKMKFITGIDLEILNNFQTIIYLNINGSVQNILKYIHMIKNKNIKVILNINNIFTSGLKVDQLPCLNCINKYVNEVKLGKIEEKMISSIIAFKAFLSVVSPSGDDEYPFYKLNLSDLTYRKINLPSGNYIKRRKSNSSTNSNSSEWVKNVKDFLKLNNLLDEEYLEIVQMPLKRSLISDRATGNRYEGYGVKYLDALYSALCERIEDKEGGNVYGTGITYEEAAYKALLNSQLLEGLYEKVEVECQNYSQEASFLYLSLQEKHKNTKIIHFELVENALYETSIYLYNGTKISSVGVDLNDSSVKAIIKTLESEKAKSNLFNIENKYKEAYKILKSSLREKGITAIIKPEHCCIGHCLGINLVSINLKGGE